jgi:N-acetylglucosamine-6-sulfatase
MSVGPGRSRTRRYGRLLVVAACLVVLATTSLAFRTSPPPAASTPPSIILILTDDQRYDGLDHMAAVKRQLVAKGVSFEDAFVSDSYCCPSRATILTGTYSHTNGIYGDSPRTDGGFRYFKDSTTIATVLQAHGYRTALMGKYMNGYSQVHARYVPPGWDRWFAFTSEPYFGFTVSDQGTNVRYGPDDYQTDVLSAQAVQFIDSTPPGQPLFLYWAPHAPHAPATPAPRYANALRNLPPSRPPNYNEEDVSDKPAYVRALPLMSKHTQAQIDDLRRQMYRTLLSIDDATQEMLSALASTGRLHNTMVVFMSDNGLLIGNHRFHAKKTVPYEESVRVPLIIRWDDAKWHESVDDHIVANVDLAATWAEAAGTTMPGSEGMSLLPILEDPSGPWRDELLLEHAEWSDVPAYCGVRAERYDYYQYSTGEEELYDLTNDPWQLQNVAGDPGYQSTLAHLRTEDHLLCDPVPPGFAWSH